MAQLIPDGDVTSWGKQINGGVIRRGLINCRFCQSLWYQGHWGYRLPL